MAHNADKLTLNGIGNPALCLRMSRANHNYSTVADHVYDDIFKVVILYAQKYIREGEEICINYHMHFNASGYVSTTTARLFFKRKVGSRWPVGPKIRDLAKEGDPRSLDCVKKLMNNHEILQSSFLSRDPTLLGGFQ